MSEKRIIEFDGEFLDALSAQASASPRLRQHHNIHTLYDDPCQRFLNAMEPGSYLRPHRHSIVPRNKLLVALRGRFAVVLFDDEGMVITVTPLATSAGVGVSVAAEVVAGTWNTVLSLAPRSVLLEMKAGPFDPAGPREPAPWSPDDGSPQVQDYVARLERIVSGWSTDSRIGANQARD